MGEWTWLHAVFPIADVELTQAPIEPQAANVLVRTVRRVPESEAGGADDMYELRVAPHNVAPFRGGPWLSRFCAAELEDPGPEFARFRARLAEAVNRAREQGR